MINAIIDKTWKLIMNKNDTLTMTKPASWHGDFGKDSTPLGNGKTGVLVRGAVRHEEIIFNRADCWSGAFAKPLPDVSSSLGEMRQLIDEGDYAKANDLMYKRLRESGYGSSTGRPIILGALSLDFKATGLFSNYKRILHMDTGECEIAYSQKSRHTSRRCFVSRADDTFYYEFSSNEDTEVSLSFDCYNDHTPNTEEWRETIQKNLTRSYYDNGFDYQVDLSDISYLVKIRIYGANVIRDNDAFKWSAKNFRIAIKCASGRKAVKKLTSPADFDYRQALASHAKLHGKLYKSCDIRLCKGKSLTNEALLCEAFQDKASPELIEKMWRFGRFLFISGTAKDGLPFPLYGLWHHNHRPLWAQHVANENVEIIHWHINAGGLAELCKPLIDYYYDGMESFRENAKKLFGCKGIFIGSYTSPICKSLSVFVPVILHFTGVAGWLSQHFCKYYKMTGDKRLLKEKILPFMVAAADFYLDYITYDKDGKVLYYPCVSPENSPKNLIREAKGQMGHPAPVTKNAVIELAIVKELFKNLITLIDETGLHADYRTKLKAVLEHFGDYQVNKDGALKEWALDTLEDNYSHRHLSHIYPLFPGNEISKGDPLYDAVERAVDLRELGAQSGWSLSHTASIYATLGRGEQVIEMLDTMLKGATLDNLFTLHNDYRNMGVTLEMDNAPVQLDANMGLVNAVQMMLFIEGDNTISLLPALPTRLSQGRASKLRFTIGELSLDWNLDKRYLSATVKLHKSGRIKIILPPFATDFTVSTYGGTTETNPDNGISFSGTKGDRIIIATSHSPKFDKNTL